MLPAYPPSSTTAVIRRGQQGWAVFALQDSLNVTAGASLVTDGDFGQATETAARDFQAQAGLVADGIAGPATQSALVVKSCAAVESKLSSMPKGMMRGLALSEGGPVPRPGQRRRGWRGGLRACAVPRLRASLHR
jgi:peptidoglycan hydrolase-like protein with peptidoglycan-binding domain